ncbi:MAG: hypothetical protein F6J93_15865 [Oscillatoria sp. SIO1A7]|nr:hypothetical protein [Oscillatoria sp. SIO1A7]
MGIGGNLLPTLPTLPTLPPLLQFSWSPSILVFRFLHTPHPTPHTPHTPHPTPHTPHPSLCNQLYGKIEKCSFV